MLGVLAHACYPGTEEKGTEGVQSQLRHRKCQVSRHSENPVCKEQKKQTEGEIKQNDLEIYHTNNV